MLQIDALAYSDLRRALELGLCPTISRLLREGFALRRWFCGLPSATPYCQAGMFHGENEGIPAFRFYDKAARKVITCNAPHGVQYIRDRIHSPGALAGGSSYVNLLDGDAQTVAFTVATREKMSVYRRLGGTRMALLMALHPIRMARMVLQGAFEWLLEEWERAKARGAKIVAEIVGYGATADAHHITAPAPDGSGAQEAMRLAMKSAGIRPEEVGYINAHGTSTPHGDAAETNAVKAVFGDQARKLIFGSTKSMTGHLLGAAGAFEFAICALALQNSLIPPTINQFTPDPACDLNSAPNHAVRKQFDVALSNSFGFGGHNVTLAVRKVT